MPEKLPGKFPGKFPGKVSSISSNTVIGLRLRAITRLFKDQGKIKVRPKVRIE
jgi:hypothetical protein